MAAATDKLPHFLPFEPREGQKLAVRLAVNPLIPVQSAATACTGSVSKSMEGEMKKPLEIQGFCKPLQPGASSFISEDDGNRTRNHRIDSPVL